MQIKNVKVGELETNVYIIYEDGESILIDPGDEFEKILPLVDKSKTVGIIVTHHHFDHVGALDEIAKATKAKVYDFANLKEGKNEIGKFEFEVIFTPGHKEDSISIYFEKEKILFSGDFIFEGTIGRWDFPGGDMNEMKKSIQKILKYPLDVKVYPGHGDSTSLGREKDNLEKYLKYF